MNNEEKLILRELYSSVNTNQRLLRERFFPEIKENEDERIRKELIEFLKSAPEGRLDISTPYKTFGKWFAWLEKQGEQTSVDKVELKFKVGDWVVDEFVGDAWHIDSIDKKNYQVSNEIGDYNYFPILDQDKMHLWSIKDAKPGDVLADYHIAFDNPLIFILKKFECVNFGLVRPLDYISYCFLTAGDRQSFREGACHHKHNIKPATKEQCDLLFQKMK